MIRASKSGYSREIKNKIDAKYDEEIAQQSLTWIQETINESMVNGELPAIDMNLDGSQQNVHKELKDGYILARLGHVLNEKIVPFNKLKGQTLVFKQMELIALFLEAVKSVGVKEMEVFQTVDLYEKQNLHQVILTIQALGRKASSLGLTGFGPKESAVNKREFSEEQLREGQSIISLQYGTNKGANQAGMNFGKNRSILD
ncbi:myophilin-like [Lineus longissimus]|uniref:myophilin-like n=1 Tax=Lineus longissimus TaxID=88925 RepID=UPI002B4F7A33